MVILNNFYRKVIKNKYVLCLGVAGTENNPRHQKRFNMLLKESRDWIGLDNNKVFIETYKHKYNIFYDDIDNLNFLKKVPNNIEVIVLTEVLEHLKKPYEVLSYIKTNKNAGTEVLISVPNGLSLGRFVFAMFNNKRLYKQDRDHLFVFNKTTLENLIKESGLEIIKTEHYVHKSDYKILSFFPNICSGFVLLCK